MNNQCHLILINDLNIIENLTLNFFSNDLLVWKIFVLNISNEIKILVKLQNIR